MWYFGEGGKVRERICECCCRAVCVVRVIRVECHLDIKERMVFGLIFRVGDWAHDLTSLNS